MATVINNPGNGGREDSGIGMIIGVLVVIVLIVLFFVYGLPAIRNNQTAPNDINVDVDLPGGDNTGGTGGADVLPPQ